MNPPQATLWTEMETHSKSRAVTPTTIKQLMGQRLAYFMNGESQNSLHKRSGISQATVGRLLHADQSASIELLETLAKHLNIRPADLLLDQESYTALKMLTNLSESEKREVLNYIEYKLSKKKDKP